MADTYLNKTGLTYLWSKIKNYILSTCLAVADVQNGVLTISKDDNDNEN